VVDSALYGRALAHDHEQFFWSMLERFPSLTGRFEHARAAGDNARTRAGRLLASGPFDRPVKRVTQPHVALVGDAAGYFDPFTGQGIYQALAGAEMLAEEASEVLTGRCDEATAWQRYEARHMSLTKAARRL